jgi:hypothetical protein
MFLRLILVAISIALFALGSDVLGWIVLGIWLALFVFDIVRRRRQRT